jgi:hypothetical protein
VAETCTGASAACPPDTYQPSGTTCRASAGPCDAAETCTGASPACPADAFLPSGVMCRGVAGLCDVAEFCTGNTAACPPDAFQPSLLVCRPAASDCDVAETCTGAGPSCPADGFVAAGTDLHIPCDGPDSDQCKRGTLQCNGVGGELCANDFPNSVEICNDADDDCDGVIDNGFDKQNDILNCGDCNIHCVNGEGSTSCSGGACHPVCNPYWGDMDGNPVNGCECDGSAFEPSSLPGGAWPELPYNGARHDGNNWSDCDHKDSYYASLVPVGDEDFFMAYLSDATFCEWEPKVYLSNIPLGTDYDLYLYKWNGSSWDAIANSRNGGNNQEYIDFGGYGGEGWYGFQVTRYAGESCGQYKLTICDGSASSCAP